MGEARRSTALPGAALVLALGCFSEPPPLSGGTSGGAAECSMGAIGCACNGNGTCNLGLECAALVELCVPEGCDPGARQCICLGTECLPGLDCTAGICVDPSEGTSATDSPDGTLGETSASADDDVGPGTSTPETSTPETSKGGEDESSSAGSSGGSCVGAPCDECQLCIDELVAIGNCTPPSNACTDECELLRQCHADGASTQQCCLDHPGGVDDYHTLACCALLSCPSCSETLCTADLC